MTKDELRNELISISLQLVFGCNNHGCLIAPPEEEGTNGRCQCDPYTIRQRLEAAAFTLKERRWA